MPGARDFWGLQSVAEYFGVSYGTARKWVVAGVVKGITLTIPMQEYGFPDVHRHVVQGHEINFIVQEGQRLGFNEEETKIPMKRWPRAVAKATGGEPVSLKDRRKKGAISTKRGYKSKKQLATVN